MINNSQLSMLLCLRRRGCLSLRFGRIASSTPALRLLLLHAAAAGPIIDSLIFCTG